MKHLIFILIFILHVTSVKSEINLAYLDVQYIIDNSKLGKVYQAELKKKYEKFKTELETKGAIIKKLENDINNQKNILKKEELNLKINNLNKKFNEYKLSQQDLNKKFVKEKRDYSKKILEVLNPLLTKYVENNKINIVVEKKNILVGVKSLDITKNILDIFNEETKKLINEKN